MYGQQLLITPMKCVPVMVVNFITRQNIVLAIKKCFTVVISNDELRFAINNVKMHLLPGTRCTTDY